MIHPTAVVGSGAKLGEGVEIGPYAVIGSDVSIGSGTRVLSHAVIDGRTTIGKNCTIYSFACVGTSAQDKRAKGINSSLMIGDQNEIREYVTISTGATEGSQTIIGSRNLIMASVHIAHDCVLGDDIVMANGTALAGYVTIEDKAVLSGYIGIHQFVKIGRLSMTGGLSKITRDVLPYSVCDGNPASFSGLNVVGLKRSGFASSECVKIKKALKELARSGAPIPQRIANLKSEFSGNPEIEALIAFVAHSKRGFTHARVHEPQDEEQE